MEYREDIKAAELRRASAIRETEEARLRADRALQDAGRRGIAGLMCRLGRCVSDCTFEAGGRRYRFQVNGSLCRIWRQDGDKGPFVEVAHMANREQSLALHSYRAGPWIERLGSLVEQLEAIRDAEAAERERKQATDRADRYEPEPDPPEIRPAVPCCKDCGRVLPADGHGCCSTERAEP